MAHSRAAAQAGVLNETQIRLLTGCRAKAQARYEDNIDEVLVGLGSIAELAAACHAWVAAAEAVDSPDPADLAQSSVDADSSQGGVHAREQAPAGRFAT